MSDTHLDRHDKLIHFRRRMRWSKNESIGFLHRFWWAVLQYAPNGDVATLPAEVLAEMLEMDSALIARALAAMEVESVRLLLRSGSHLLVCNWLQYAGRYLRDSLYKNHPEKWKLVCELHGLSADDPPTVSRPSAVQERTRQNLNKESGREWIERERRLAKSNGSNGAKP